jgi:23S rRNA pseudouridine2605 synthase
MIRAGRVTVDGRVATIGEQADPVTARIAVDGVPLPVRPGLTYVLVNKPPGVISAATDPQGRPTVVGLVAASTRLYPVGRLDADSEGLILLTNDGTLTNLVTHPSGGVTKTYVARVAGSPGTKTMRRLQTGVELDDGPARALAARVVDRGLDSSMVELVMGEGRNREVRRLLVAVGHEVLQLVRTAIGPLRDRELRPGSWRALTTAEVRSLYAAAGATWEDAPEPLREEG